MNMIHTQCLQWLLSCIWISLILINQMQSSARMIIWNINLDYEFGVLVPMKYLFGGTNSENNAEL